MTPEERRGVLEALLARVRATAAERGLQLPPDLPPRSARDQGRADALASTDDVTSDAPPMLADAPAGGNGAGAAHGPSRPLVRFDVEDEITSTADPEKLEALALVEERYAPAAPTHPGSDPPETEPPPTLGGGMAATAEAPAYKPLPSLPLELDDLDSLGVPAGSTPPPPVAVPAMPPLPEVAAAPPPLPPLEGPEDGEQLVTMVVPTPMPLAPSRDDVIELDEADFLGDERDASEEAPMTELVGAPPSSAAITDESSYEGLARETLHEPPTDTPLEDDDAVPASQRQPRLEGRPIDDALEGVEDDEPPPKSGEVESQRYPSQSARAQQIVEADRVSGEAAEAVAEDEAPTPPPREAPAARASGAQASGVTVVERPVPLEAEIVTITGSRAPRSFGELLDEALALGDE